MTEEKTKLQDFFENPDRYKSQDSVKQTQSCAASTVDLTEEPRELDEFAIRKLPNCFVPCEFIRN